MPADFWDWRDGQDFSFGRRRADAAAFTAEADALELAGEPEGALEDEAEQACPPLCSLSFGQSCSSGLGSSSGSFGLGSSSVHLLCGKGVFSPGFLRLGGRFERLELNIMRMSCPERWRIMQTLVAGQQSSQLMSTATCCRGGDG